ncbi:yebG family protein [Yersinia rohdei]|uniref:DNA damage-inducible gene in SOS regulon,dependent on cyclic AMP and H-NS n=1 Tax=Yersinia rohdei TaxID=29485 RepID=A0A0U1HMY6_YERRO|nr:YebG family protein [Yersinia rohdei]AJJ10567.1 yebG family protein [Yersinia rohdei]EEQ04440.1 YebG family protein [Yersinia rohdei ATCC 43380]MDN0093189.1 YebG family protein [Yersinia rohdei]CNE68087.1 DNA damage-inducible gene in SOS regulon%2Cdependent on cyclic AMP and H-NS [Yersinia rohdei]CNI78283.1 DNA damage-inducible gene in SOS regulon%2Cdependent on cyclic AMP and H-NS [Yersinia rohdei]
MAVEIKFVVVRQGEEKMTFTTKKEADAYDKMLDLADNLSEWLSQAPLTLEEEQREALSFFLAEHKDALGQILRGASPSTPADPALKLTAEKNVAEKKSKPEENQAA